MKSPNDKRSDLSGPFKEIAGDVLRLRRFTNSEIEQVLREVPSDFCGDQHVGRTDKWTDEKFSTREFVWECQQIQGDAVIVVLESPHIKEFLESPPQPAIDKTGRLLRVYYRDVTNLQLEKNVFLVNAIRYQCSLGNAYKTIKSFDCYCEKMLPLHEIKEEILCCCLSGRVEFVNDLKVGIKQILDLVGGHVTLINACTCGGCRKYYNVVTGCLMAMRDDNKEKINVVFETAHPSSWYSGRTSFKNLIER